MDHHDLPAQVGGVGLAQMSFADDGNGFGEGEQSAQLIADALGTGCVQAGLSLDCKQGSGYTTGEPSTVSISHIGADGRPCTEQLRVTKPEAPARLLGVTSAWRLGPAESVAQLDRQLRLQLGLCRTRHCDVFELRSAVTLFMHSLLVYAPDSQRIPLSLAHEWDGMIVTAARRALRIHPSSTAHLVFACSSAGGLGFHSCVAQVLANRARELLASFEGSEVQAQIRRGRWESLRARDVQGSKSKDTMLQESVDFLASHGWYLRDSRELFLSRVAAALARNAPGWATSGYRPGLRSEAAARARYSSVGPLFACLRVAFRHSPTQAQSVSTQWWARLARVPWRTLPATPDQLAAAVQIALDEARQDWYTERRIFHGRAATPRDAALPWWQQENWLGDAANSCPRAQALDRPRGLPEHCDWAASDGGGRGDASSAAYVFAAVPWPADLSSSLPRPDLSYRQQARLPVYIGTRRCGVHEGELAGLLGCAAASPTADACCIGVDRVALIDLVDDLPARGPRETLKGNFPPWETRLGEVLKLRDVLLPSSAPALVVPKPSDMPDWRASTRYRATRLVHVPSHQPLEATDRVPCNMLASLNHWADIGCEEASAPDPPASILKPAGGTRFFLEHLGKTVIGDPAVWIRAWYAADATTNLEALSVQGLLAGKSHDLWDLDIACWRGVHVPTGLEPLAQVLAPQWQRGDTLDMHQWIFRMRAGLGGSYVSLARRNSVYRAIADRIADDLDPEGHDCLLCGMATGTRRHALFACPFAEEGLPSTAEQLREAMYAYAESRLAKAGFPGLSRFSSGHARPLLHPEHASQYPRLAQAGWLLPTLGIDGEPAGDLDLAGRIALPAALASAIMWPNAAVSRPVLVHGAEPESLNGRFEFAGSWNAHAVYRNVQGAVFSFDEGHWQLTSAGEPEEPSYKQASDEPCPPGGSWPSARGHGACVVKRAPRGSLAVPWRERETHKLTTKSSEAARAERRLLVQELLSGVALHLVVLRKRYLAGLAAWSHRWLRRRERSLLPARAVHRHVRPARPCSGPLCSQARASGLRGGLAFGCFSRCATCRQHARVLSAAACLEQMLGARGSSLRRARLYELRPLADCCITRVDPGLQGASPRLRHYPRYLAACRRAPPG